MKQARRSFGPSYDCQKPWPDGCSVQCGDKGLVLSQKGNYTTAFFEAFPDEPNTFIRGEGATVEEAENDAWEQLERFRACPNHEFERRGYKNGAGFCKHCGLFKSKCFEPSTLCIVCQKPTNYSPDIDGNWWCEEHYHLKPEEKMTSVDKMVRQWAADIEEIKLSDEGDFQP